MNFIKRKKTLKSCRPTPGAPSSKNVKTLRLFANSQYRKLLLEPNFPSYYIKKIVVPNKKMKSLQRLELAMCRFTSEPLYH